MKQRQRKRLYWILTILFGVSLATSLTIYALGQNINLYLTPAQLAQHQPAANRIFRMGGMVKKGSFKRSTDSLAVTFVLTDYTHDISVEYTGILPDLFREGQGVVVQGVLDEKGVFIADQVLAKHDEKYMPPLVTAKS